MSTTYEGNTYYGSAPGSMIAMSIALPILCIATVAIRFKVRRHNKTPCEIDDWTALAAVLGVIGMGVIAVVGTKDKLWGYPSARNPPPNIVLEGKLLYSFQYIQILTLTCIKLSALLLYRRAFSTSILRTAFHIVTFVTGVVVVLWFLAMAIVDATQCGSHPSTWWLAGPNWLIYCKHVYPFQAGFAISNAILDLWILILPVMKVVRLHTSIRQRLAIMGVFLLGIVGFLGSVTRMVFVLNIIYDLGFTKQVDPLLQDTQLVYWSNFEVGLCLIAVNLPCISPAVARSFADSALRTLRSITSFHSLRSDGSRSGEKDSRSGPPSSNSAVAISTTFKISQESAASNYDHDLEAYRHQVPQIPEIYQLQRDFER